MLELTKVLTKSHKLLCKFYDFQWWDHFSCWGLLTLLRGFAYAKVLGSELFKPETSIALATTTVYILTFYIRPLKGSVYVCMDWRAEYALTKMSVIE